MAFENKRTRAIAAIAAIAFVFLLGMGAERILNKVERTEPGDSLFPAAYAQNRPQQEDIPSVIEKAVPAVVNIQTKKVRRIQTQVPSIFQDPFFRQFFGDDFQRRFNIPQERVERSLGSGVIVSEDGYILTNNHLVGNVDEVIVILPDDRQFTARVVFSDARTEVAILKIDSKKLPTLPFGDSSKLRLGDTVIAIGYPFGVGQTVTQGIVSGLSKPVAEGRGVFVDFIQTDAAINPGNSGGALINIRGELVGINTLIISNTGSYAGLSFAIPINIARDVMNEVIAHGRVVRGYLGVDMDNLTADNAEFFGAKSPEGVIITYVVPDSPAEKAGLKIDDVITGVNGEQVKNMNDLRRLVAAMKPGEKARLEIIRDGKPMKITATVAARPEDEEVSSSRESKEEESGAVIKPELALLEGVALEELNRYYRSELRIPSDIQGVLVTEVDPASKAADQGLREGDVIIALNRQPTRSLREFSERVKGIKQNRVLLTIWRDGRREFVVLKQ